MCKHHLEEQEFWHQRGNGLRVQIPKCCEVDWKTEGKVGRRRQRGYIRHFILTIISQFKIMSQNTQGLNDPHKMVWRQWLKIGGRMCIAYQLQEIKMGRQLNMCHDFLWTQDWQLRVFQFYGTKGDVPKWGDPFIMELSCLVLPAQMLGEDFWVGLVWSS